MRWNLCSAKRVVCKSVASWEKTYRQAKVQLFSHICKKNRPWGRFLWCFDIPSDYHSTTMYGREAWISALLLAICMTKNEKIHFSNMFFCNFYTFPTLSWAFSYTFPTIYNYNQPPVVGRLVWKRQMVFSCPLYTAFVLCGIFTPTPSCQNTSI